MATSSNYGEEQPAVLFRPIRPHQLPRHLHDFVIDSPSYLTRRESPQVMEVEQEEFAEDASLIGTEALGLEGMEARMRDIARQMRQLQSAMDSVKGQTHPPRNQFDSSYPRRISSLPHINGTTRTSPLMDNQMSSTSADGGHRHLLDNYELGPPTTQSTHQQEISSTTKAVRALQPSVQVAAPTLDLGDLTRHSAALTGSRPESSQPYLTQSTHHTPLPQRVLTPPLPVMHTDQHIQPIHHPAQPIINRPVAPLTRPPTLYTAQPASPQPQGTLQPFTQQPNYLQHVQQQITYSPGLQLGFQPPPRQVFSTIPQHQPATDPASYSFPQAGYPPAGQPQLYQPASQPAAYAYFLDGLNCD
ncbi:uncharacterized protein LOC130914373 [Corythoichthys intestinalis]|uniref:uncharacterized protein LOC130914373 n=1 Tax=Corythoichthys intestinalis TaxID=161448 RepID=UPI0025A6347C|nr:uncharacterized protein LOC130914373 [Corythoichthys intestinalis]